jgi:predicted nuclease of predicted toxin-antitoxin system
MQIRLLLDANLSWRSVKTLKNCFDDCCHVDDIEFVSVPAKDTQIWEYARKNEMIIITNDEDFLHLSTIKGFPPKVVLLKMGNQHRKFIEQVLITAKEQILTFIASSEYGVLEII